MKIKKYWQNYLLNKKMNKKGDTELISREVMFMIFVALFAVVLAAFVYMQSNGFGMREQYLSKQIALLIDSSRDGTVISLDPNGMQRVSIDSVNHEVFVQANESSTGRRYPYFNTGEIKFESSVNGLIKITIEQK